MKKLFIFSALLVVFVGFTACGGGGGTEKSSEKDILSFKVDGVPWDINPNTRNITKEYPKGTTNLNFVPTIEFSPKATVEPKSGVSKDFSTDQTYTVTAEDGSTKEYKATATVAQQ